MEKTLEGKIKNHKRLLSIILTVVLSVFICCSCSAQEAKNDDFILTTQIGNPVMTVNGAEQSIDENGTAPVVQNGRTLVPIRAIIEAMGGSVTWKQDSQTTILSYNGDKIDLIINSNTAYLNNMAINVDTAPVVINSRTMLPIRFIAESFKFDIEWNEDNQTISIKKQSGSSNEIAADETQTLAEDKADNKILVAYFSATGSTEKVAKYIAEAVDADIFKIEPVKPYTNEDLNYNDENSRVCVEHSDEEKREIELVSTAVTDWETYNTVFIGYPIWWGIAAWPINGFVEANDFTEKTVIPFCTSASSSLGESDELLQELAGTGDWSEGKRFSSGVSESDVKEWVINEIKN